VEASPHCLRLAGASRPPRAGAGLLPAKRRAGLPDFSHRGPDAARAEIAKAWTIARWRAMQR